MIRFAFTICVLVAAAGPAPAFGQTVNTFQDVPLSHRAYRDMASLCDRGLLQGYAKRHFDGHRAYSRYEFAVALDRVLKTVTFPSIDTAHSGSTQRYGESISVVVRLTGEFKDDLHNLGYTDSTIVSAVASLEKRLRESDSRSVGVISLSGRPSDALPGRSGLLTFRSDAAATGAATSSSLHRLTLTGGQSQILGPGLTLSLSGSGRLPGASLGISFSDPTGLPGVRPLEGDRSVTGVRTDAIRLSGTFGSVSSDFYTAQVAVSSSTFGAAPDGLPSGLLAGYESPIAGALRGPLPGDGVSVDRVTGVSVGIGVRSSGEQGRIRLNAATATGTNTQASTGSNNVFLLGTAADFKLTSRLSLSADFGRTIAGPALMDSADSTDANAYNVKIGFLSRGLNIMAGYRYIDPMYYAPGYWGRIGGWMNPTNVQGPQFRADYTIGRKFGLNFGGDFYTSAKDRDAPGGLGPNDDVNRLQVGLRWDISRNFRTTVDWEGVYWHLSGARLGLPTTGVGAMHPTEHFITLGTGYSLTSNMLLRLTYQIGDFNGQGLLTSGPSRSSFSAISSEVAIKF